MHESATRRYVALLYRPPSAAYSKDVYPAFVPVGRSGPRAAQIDASMF